MTEITIGTPEDNLADELLAILETAGISNKHMQWEVLSKLLPYLVARDHKLLTHAYTAGRASA
jgi:hypothetical protein